jgi:hypothetical protein
MTPANPTHRAPCTESELRREAAEAEARTVVQCVGCGRSFRGRGLICLRCRFKPRTPA